MRHATSADREDDNDPLGKSIRAPAGWLARLDDKKLFRLYREERLTVRPRGGRKRAIGTRSPMAVPQGPNQRWSVDFLHDVLADGRRFRVFAAVDDFTRECLALTVDTAISGARVVRELGRIAELRGRPCMIVSDNGTELTSNAVLAWSHETGIEWHYIALGNPMHRRHPCLQLLPRRH